VPTSAKIKLSKDWKRLEKAMDKNGPTIRKHIRRATAFIGKKGEAIIRDEIANGSYEPNRPLTVALKGGKNEPLKGDRPGAPLFKSITSKIINDFTVFIGILQTSKKYNIALTIHEGVAVKVTEKMRGLFYILWLKEQRPSIELTGRAKELWDKMPGGWLPLKASTTAIDIPSRPFIKNAWNKGGLQKLAVKFWDSALKAAFKEMGQK
jgi:hypothetical protein